MQLTLLPSFEGVFLISHGFSDGLVAGEKPDVDGTSKGSPVCSCGTCRSGRHWNGLKASPRTSFSETVSNLP